MAFPPSGKHSWNPSPLQETSGRLQAAAVQGMGVTAPQPDSVAAPAVLCQLPPTPAPQGAPAQGEAGGMTLYQVSLYLPPALLAAAWM